MLAHAVKHVEVSSPPGVRIAWRPTVTQICRLAFAVQSTGAPPDWVTLPVTLPSSPVARAHPLKIQFQGFLGFGDLRMAEEISRGHIYAVEADRECFDLLVRNASENDAKNITPINRAAWNDESELELESGFAQANSLVKEVHQAETTQLVRTTTIDLLVSEYGIEKLDMISLTLNGAEVETLEAAGETLSRLRPRIRLAGWYSRGGRKIWEITKQQLEAHGYEVFVGDRGNLMALPRNAEVMR